jgi:hypothetical protein
MSNAINPTYYRGQGRVFVSARNSSGPTGGWFAVGDASKLEISVKETFEDVRESMTGLRTRVVHTSVQSDVDFTMDVMNFSGYNLAQAMLGSTAALTGATVTAEVPPVAEVVPGSGFYTKYPNISAVAVTNAAGSTTYVAGTDYFVNAASGRIDVASAGAITLNESLKVNYTYASAAAVVQALTNLGSREFHVVFEGVNMDQQATPVLVVMPRVFFNLTQMITLLDVKTSQFAITGALLPAPEITTGGISQFFTTTITSQNTLYAP